MESFLDMLHPRYGFSQNHSIGFNVGRVSSSHVVRKLIDPLDNRYPLFIYSCAIAEVVVEIVVVIKVDVLEDRPYLLKVCDGLSDIAANLTIFVLPRLVGAAEDRGLRRRERSGVVVIGLHDEVGVGGGGIWRRQDVVCLRWGEPSVQNTSRGGRVKLQIVPVGGLIGFCSIPGGSFGLGAETEASIGKKRIGDRGLKPTSAGHPRFGRKDEAEASQDEGDSS